MATITFETGQTVNFDGNPTPKDIEEVAAHLNVQKPADTPQSAPQTDFLQTAANAVGSVFPGQQIGKALGNNLYGLSRLAHGDVQGFTQAADEVGQNFGKIVGDTANAVATPASMALAPAKTLLGSAAQYSALGAVSAGGQSLSQGNTGQQAVNDAQTGGEYGAALGPIFNLLGRGISGVAKKLGPTALSFTSGVPKDAISQAGANPEAAKIGLGMSVREVRDKAVTSLNSLHQDLGNEFEQGMKQVSQAQPPNAMGIKAQLMSAATDHAGKYSVPVTETKGLLTPNFDTSAIVKSGEKAAVQEALKTVSSWSDFSGPGIQQLSTRIGALKNFDEGGISRSSAIVGKIYHAVGDVIRSNYPDLATLKTNFAKNKDVLDQIQSVLSANKDDPKAIQASVSRLDNIFKENRDEYVNIIKELGQRSGVDYLSLLAGGEFQKILPGFIRGVGGGAAVGVGAQALNPYVWLLAPLFSPRAVGLLTRNASGVAEKAPQLTRAATTQAIQRFVPLSASQQ